MPLSPVIFFFLTLFVNPMKSRDLLPSLVYSQILEKSHREIKSLGEKRILRLGWYPRIVTIILRLGASFMFYWTQLAWAIKHRRVGSSPTWDVIFALPSSSQWFILYISWFIWPMHMTSAYDQCICIVPTTVPAHQKYSTETFNKSVINQPSSCTNANGAPDFVNCNGTVHRVYHLLI